MELAIIYGTTKGHSKHLSEFVAGKLKNLEFVSNVVVHDVARLNEMLTEKEKQKHALETIGLDEKAVKGIAIITSITGTRYNAGMVQFLKTLKESDNALNAETTVFASVSGCATGIGRSDLTDAERESAVKVTSKWANGLFDSIQWHPKPDFTWYIGGNMDSQPSGFFGNWVFPKLLTWMWGFTPKFGADQTDYELLEKQAMDWANKLKDM